MYETHSAQRATDERLGEIARIVNTPADYASGGRMKRRRWWTPWRPRHTWPFDRAVECPELNDRGGHVRHIAGWRTS